MTCANVCGCNMCAYECLVGVSVTCVHDRCERESVCGRAMCVSVCGVGDKERETDRGAEEKSQRDFLQATGQHKGKVCGSSLC